MSLTLSSGALAQTPAKGSPEHVKAVTSAVDGASIKANTATSNDWPTIGLDYAETRFSKLNQINADNVKKLGLVWSYPLDPPAASRRRRSWSTASCTQTASWSVVHAIDARTGKQLWTFDPKVDRAKGYNACCDVVNRGVALWEGKVFVGAYDGRLIALDAATGKAVWEKDTLIDKEHSYTITGAPRVFKGKVIIGNGGAEYGVRGYVSAYDAETGKQAGACSPCPAIRRSRSKTNRWRPRPRPGSRQVLDQRRRRNGVGHHHLRSRPRHALCRHRQRLALEPRYPQPLRRRQSLLASIVALNADTGEYVWHYQETPGDTGTTPRPSR